MYIFFYKHNTEWVNKNGSGMNCVEKKYAYSSVIYPASGSGVDCVELYTEPT